MSNLYSKLYDYVAGSLARGEHPKAEFDGIQSAFTTVETDILRAIKLPVGDSGDITENAATRANKVIGFNGLGEVTPLTLASLSLTGLDTLLSGETADDFFVWNGTVWENKSLAATKTLLGVSATQDLTFLGSTFGLVVENNVGTPDTIMDIRVHGVKVKDISGNSTLLVNQDLSADIATSGADGLDTGSAVNSTWYGVWVGYNATTAIAILSLLEVAGTTTSGATNKLVDSGAAFSTTENLNVGDVVYNTTTNEMAFLTAVDSGTQLSLSSNIMGSGENYSIVRMAEPKSPPSGYVEWCRVGANYRNSGGQFIPIKNRNGRVERTDLNSTSRVISNGSATSLTSVNYSQTPIYCTHVLLTTSERCSFSSLGSVIEIKEAQGTVELMHNKKGTFWYSRGAEVVDIDERGWLE